MTAKIIDDTTTHARYKILLVSDMENKSSSLLIKAASELLWEDGGKIEAAGNIALVPATIEDTCTTSDGKTETVINCDDF